MAEGNRKYVYHQSINLWAPRAAHPVVLRPYTSICSSEEMEHSISKFFWEQNSQTKSAKNNKRNNNTTQSTDRKRSIKLQENKRLQDSLKNSEK